MPLRRRRWSFEYTRNTGGDDGLQGYALESRHLWIGVFRREIGSSSACSNQNGKPGRFAATVPRSDDGVVHRSWQNDCFWKSLQSELCFCTSFILKHRIHVGAVGIHPGVHDVWLR